MARQAAKLFSQRIKSGETKRDYKRRMSREQSRTPTSPGAKIVVGIDFDPSRGTYEREVSVVAKSHKRAGWIS